MCTEDAERTPVSLLQRDVTFYKAWAELKPGVTARSDGAHAPQSSRVIVHLFFFFVETVCPLFSKSTKVFIDVDGKIDKAIVNKGGTSPPTVQTVQ